MSRELVVQVETPQGPCAPLVRTEKPTASDLIEFSMSNPTTAVAVFDGARVARAWEDRFPRTTGRYHVWTRYSADRPGLAAAEVVQDQVGHDWTVVVCGNEVPGRFTTAADAKAAADIRLADLGVALDLGAP